MQATHTDGRPSVAVVTINFGPPDDTLSCIRSLRDTCYPRLKIIVVDNGSAPEERAALQEGVPADVDLILLNANVGFAAGNNIGIARARDLGADYTMLVNNDATVERNAIRVLAETAREIPHLGILTGKILVANDGKPAEHIWYAGGVWSPIRGTGYHVGIGERDVGQFDEAVEPEFASGCFWFVPSQVFNEVGPLREEYFLYSEDIDYCLQLRRAGYRLFYQPRAVCYHRVSGSHWRNRERASPVLQYYSNRNRVLIARRWLSPMQRVIFYPYFLTSRLALALLRRDSSYLAGVWDGLNGRVGPRP